MDGYTGLTQGAAGAPIPEEPSKSENASVPEEASNFSLGIVGPSGTCFLHPVELLPRVPAHGVQHVYVTMIDQPPLADVVIDY
jgi:hypothetical protein